MVWRRVDPSNRSRRVFYAAPHAASAAPGRPTLAAYHTTDRRPPAQTPPPRPLPRDCRTSAASTQVGMLRWFGCAHTRGARNYGRVASERLSKAGGRKGWPSCARKGVGPAGTFRVPRAPIRQQRSMVPVGNGGSTAPLPSHGAMRHDDGGSKRHIVRSNASVFGGHPFRRTRSTAFFTSHRAPGRFALRDPSSTPIAPVIDRAGRGARLGGANATRR